MKKKLISFLTVLVVLLTLTVSTVIASDMVSPQLADDDNPDFGLTTPLTAIEYV